MERESTALGHEMTYHTAEDPEQSATKKAEYKAAIKQLERVAAMTPTERLADQEMAALGTMLGKKSDADVDAATVER